MAAEAKHARLLPYSLLLLAILPNLIWILLDKGLTQGDPAFYQLTSIHVSHLFHSDLRLWLSAMIYQTPAKAPLLWWLGQFFVPLGAAFGSVGTGLLLMNFIAQYAVLLLLYESLSRLFGKRWIAMAGCLSVAGSALFVTLATRYWVEPLQLLLVGWIVFLVSGPERRDRLSLFLLLICAVALSLLAKASSPLYLVAPLAIAAWQLPGGERSAFRIRGRHLVYAALAAAALLLALAWYLPNLQALTRFVSHAATSANYVIPGEPGLGGRLGYWAGNLVVWFYSVPVAAALLASLLAAAVLAMRKPPRAAAGFRGATLLSLGALSQLTLALGVFATTSNPDVRYLLPLLPYSAILLCWSLWKIDWRPLTSLAVLVFCGQLALTQAEAFGFVEPKARHYGIPFIDRAGEQRPLFYGFRPLDRVGEYIPLFDQISRLPAFQAPNRIYFATLPLFQARDVRLHALSRGRDYGSTPEVSDIETTLDIGTLGGDTVDVDAFWESLLADPPAYYVTHRDPQQALRNWGLAETGWGRRIMQPTLRISERVRSSSAWAPVQDFQSEDFVVYALQEP